MKASTRESASPLSGRFALPAPTAAGEAGLVYRIHPFTIVEVFLPGNLPPGFSSLAREESPDPGALRVAGLLAAYFEGAPAPPEMDIYDLSGLSENARRVLRVVAAIPRGETRTYGQVALAAGFPRGARFAGNVVAKNPVPVFIPCHRVVRAGGDIGRFGGGTDLKRRMLTLEGALKR